VTRIALSSNWLDATSKFDGFSASRSTTESSKERKIVEFVSRLCVTDNALTGPRTLKSLDTATRPLIAMSMSWMEEIENELSPNEQFVTETLLRTIRPELSMNTTPLESASQTKTDELTLTKSGLNRASALPGNGALTPRNVAPSMLIDAASLDQSAVAVRA
jgi:hypothetical protein